MDNQENSEKTLVKKRMTKREKTIKEVISLYIKSGIEKKVKTVPLIAYVTNKNRVIFSNLPLEKIYSPLGNMLVKTEMKKIKVKGDFGEDESFDSFIFGGFGVGIVHEISADDLPDDIKKKGINAKSKEELKELLKINNIDAEHKEMLLLHIVEKDKVKILQHDVISVDATQPKGDFVVSPDPIFEKAFTKQKDVSDNLYNYVNIFK